jgi:hypothetical protein
MGQFPETRRDSLSGCDMSPEIFAGKQRAMRVSKNNT